MIVKLVSLLCRPWSYFSSDNQPRIWLVRTQSLLLDTDEIFFFVCNPPFLSSLHDHRYLYRRVRIFDTVSRVLPYYHEYSVHETSMMSSEYLPVIEPL